MNIQQGTDQHNRIISFGALECQQPQLLVLEIITFKFGKWWGEKKPPQPHNIPNQEQPAVLPLSISTKQGHVSPQLLLHVSLPHNYWFYCHRIKGERQDSFLGGSQSQTLHIWQSTANKNLIPSPSLWNQKVFFPNLLFVVCSSLKGKPGKCTFCRTKKKKLNSIW